MFRSLQENACIVSAINLEKVQAFTGLTFEEIVFAGGASKGTLWCQILSDVTGCRIKVPVVKEATALGAAMCAAVGAGIYGTIEEASSAWVKWECTYTPDPQNTEHYQSVKKRWQQVYEKQLELVDEGVVKPMWKAPGVL
jgi:autoinducer 2 (AI-2) kinase